MNAAVHKNCCVCGNDVSRTRRVKDPRGNYYCRPCYETLWEAHQQRLREQATSRAEAAAAAILIDEASEVAAAAADADLVPVAESVEAPRAAAVPEFRVTAMPASGDQDQPAERAFSIGRALSRAASALSALRAAEEPVIAVTVRRVKSRRARSAALRLSDLIGEEAQAAVDAARLHPRIHEAEVPVSPITNLPVSALVNDYAELVEPREPIVRHALDNDDGLPHRSPFSDISFSTATAS